MVYQHQRYQRYRQYQTSHRVQGEVSHLAMLMTLSILIPSSANQNGEREQPERDKSTYNYVMSNTSIYILMLTTLIEKASCIFTCYLLLFFPCLNFYGRKNG